MKKIFFLIAACLFSASLLTQTTPPPNSDFRGIWFYTALPTDTNKLKADLDTILAKGIALKGVQIAVPWWRLQENAPAQLPCDTCDHHSDLNSYKWADKLDAFLKIIAARNLNIGLLVYTSQDAPIGVAKSGSSCNRKKDDQSNRPDWLSNSDTTSMTRGGWVHWFLTDNSGTNLYPDYFGRKDTGVIIPGLSRYESYWQQLLRDLFNHIIK